MATGSDRRERSGRSHRRRRGASVDALPLLLGGGAAVRKDPRRLGGGTGLVVAAVGALALWGLARRVGQEGGVGSVVRHRTAGHAGRGGGRGRGNAHTAHKDSAGDVGLVFAWDVLAHTPYGRVWGFFVRARVDGVGLVLFDNYPGLVNNPSPRRRYLNVRKHPFRFGQATEVVQNVTEGSGEAVRRQMLLYKVSTLPELLTGKG
ncbi:hypothetical protein I4F81_009258 [Pyropia yezoensis]|uniref:Uncharacterized protein n=1 Tax=Pyropia yezoensis TaxID=2788 RepID=A0ACC3CA28_PYRYE|nr:hypothetical protein I4F81_009258 [Neopyropia yezoensis]